MTEDEGEDMESLAEAIGMVVLAREQLPMAARRRGVEAEKVARAISESGLVEVER